MAVTSQNGFSANDRSVIASFTIPGTTQKISLRKGDASVILLDLLGWIHANIEPLDQGIFDDWGYAERTIRGSSTTLSNHASGTAADANATQHPLGVRGTWTEDERRRVNARLDYYEGCVRWGDNYSGRVDGMHFEINKGAADCRRVADKIRANLGAPPVEDDLPTPADVWDFKINDPWDGSLKPARDLVGWAATHAAFARGDAAAAKTAVSALAAQVAQLKATPDGGVAGPASLSDADVQRIADAVLAELAKRAAA